MSTKFILFKRTPGEFDAILGVFSSGKKLVKAVKKQQYNDLWLSYLAIHKVEQDQFAANDHAGWDYQGWTWNEFKACPISKE